MVSHCQGIHPISASTHTDPIDPKVQPQPNACPWWGSVAGREERNRIITTEALFILRFRDTQYIPLDVREIIYDALLPNSNDLSNLSNMIHCLESDNRKIIEKAVDYFVNLICKKDRELSDIFLDDELTKEATSRLVSVLNRDIPPHTVYGAARTLAYLASHNLPCINQVLAA